MLDWSTPGPISFSNSPDCVITLFSECSVIRDINPKSTGLFGPHNSLFGMIFCEQLVIVTTGNEEFGPDV